MPTIEQTQLLPISLDQAWSFLSDPQNLPIITPPELGFQIASNVPSEMYEGLVITYRITPVLGIPMTWVSEIAHMRAPYYFVDRQLCGPYRYWYHEHELREVDGGVEMSDRINFGLPFGPLGQVAYLLFVKRQLDHIFSYRRKVLEERFTASMK